MRELKEYRVLLLDAGGNIVQTIPVVVESPTIALCRGAILAHDMGVANFDLEVPASSEMPKE